MASLVIGDHQRQQIKAVGFGRAGFGFVDEISFDGCKGGVVVGFGAQRANVGHVTLSGSILSYSPCVPTNFTKTRLYR